MPDPTGYLREVVQELKKVTWPTKAQTYNKTMLVIGVSTLVGLFITLLDFMFQNLLHFVL